MNKNNIVPLFVCCLLQNLTSNALANESINSMLFYYGSAPPLSASSLPVLAEHDLIVMDRFRYREINGNTAAAIKAVSPNTKIFIYQLGPHVSESTDAYALSGLNNLGRYNVSRGSSEGSLNNDHPDWFLKNSYGERVRGVRSSSILSLDYGNQQFADYWAKHTLEDITFQEWSADGIFVDEVALCSPAFLKNHPVHTPAKYSNCESWNKNMSDFLAQISGELQKNNQLVMANVGNSINESVPAAWRQLAQRESAPDYLVEEGAFAISWGSTSEVRFWPLQQWQQQIDLPGSVSRHVVFNSHTDLAPTQSGVSHAGAKVSHSQIMRYIVGSYLLARNASGPATYLSFDDDRKQKNGSYKTLRSTEVFNEFDIGVPTAQYEIKSPDQNLYFRKFSNGYVYVNPTGKTITAIKAESDAEFSSKHTNARNDGEDWYFDLEPHDAAIVAVQSGVTKNKQSRPPNPPILEAN